MKRSTALSRDRSEFVRAFAQGFVIAAFIVLLLFVWNWSQRQSLPVTDLGATQGSVPTMVRPSPNVPAPVRLPDFAGEKPSRDVRHIANWSFVTGDHGSKAVVILDKKEAKVYTFDAGGRLIASTPVLLGSAIGDHLVPGIGDKPLKDIRPEEKTTHAGRFVAEAGVNTEGEDVVWVDYGAALSMHRVRATKASERRLERLASPTDDDNRISYGCINVPVGFYEGVLSPVVQKTGAVIYVLPETRTAEEVFGSWDVTNPDAHRS